MQAGDPIASRRPVGRFTGPLLRDVLAQASLDQAEYKLDRTVIVSPIDGIVLARLIEPGQTVTAGFTTPVLFKLAENLTQMTLHVDIDEADVGSVKVGQDATFTVSAYLSRPFPARITRVGFGSTLKENVVTYVAELSVANDELLLRPGMTATASIAAVQRQDVLLVPNAALRFTPGAAPAKAAAGGAELLSKLMPGPPRGAPKRAGAVDVKHAERKLWLLRDGAPVAVSVTAGLSDGRRTEISGAVHEGDAVIVDQLAGPPR